MLRGKCALFWNGLRRPLIVACGLALALGGAVWAASHSRHHPRHSSCGPQLEEGRDIFRYDTFGDERQWTDTLRMHEVIQQSLDPLTALGLGLKVDVEAIPDNVLAAILSGEVDLTDPAATLTLLEHDAVVGIVGKVKRVKGRPTLVSVGITCALCHSTVDDSLMPGVGRRLDGWANLDLNPGAIIALSPAVPAEQKAVYNSWGPGMYDPRFNIDGLSTPIVIPPAYGLFGVAKETYTGDGDVSYWNNYVAVTQMGGQGVFVDPRLGLRVVHHPDRVHSKLKPLLDYQLSLTVPPPPSGSFDPDLAEEGAWVFNTIGRCVECHSSPQYTDINDGILHDATEVGQDGAYAARTATGQYRTTPLRGLWQHAPYFHDGSAATLEDVVEHYDTQFDLKLEERDKVALVEFLKSI